MAALPASRAVVLPDISAGDGHANSVQTPPSRRSSSSVATPTTSPALAVTRQLASPEATASLSGEPSSTPHSMGRSTVITTAARIASPATFLNSDARLYPRDGRVRDPVPSKLKGVSGDLSGNFSVMHMDVNSHPKSKGRDAAAKRTSEGTALQAKLASTSSYVSHHRRANYPKPTGLKQYASSTPSQVQQLPAAAAHPIIPAPTAWLPSSDQELIMLPLTPREVKSEQARLLTLLRTLPPATVVDQLCKALAFFGGIPEAPPPADGCFPDSGEANGPGSLFVGWVSEIFPNLEQPRRPVLRAPEPSAPEAPAARPVTAPLVEQVTPPVKRPRGRPKGSKASKVRCDKGIKKGPLKSAHKHAIAPTSSRVGPAERPDNSQDREASADYPTGTNAEAQITTNESQVSRAIEAAHATTQSDQIVPTAPRKRGRPKGSKNKPKENLHDVIPAQTQHNPSIASAQFESRNMVEPQLASTDLPRTALPATAAKDQSIQPPHAARGVHKSATDSTPQDSRTHEHALGATQVPGSHDITLESTRSTPITGSGVSADKSNYILTENSLSHTPNGRKRKRQVAQEAHPPSANVAVVPAGISRLQEPLSSAPISQSPYSEGHLDAHVVADVPAVPKTKRPRSTKTVSHRTGSTVEAQIHSELEESTNSINIAGQSTNIGPSTQTAQLVQGSGHGQQARQAIPRYLSRSSVNNPANTTRIREDRGDQSRRLMESLPREQSASVAGQQTVAPPRPKNTAAQVAAGLSQSRTSQSKKQRHNLPQSQNNDKASTTPSGARPTHPVSLGQQAQQKNQQQHRLHSRSSGSSITNHQGAGSPRFGTGPHGSPPMLSAHTDTYDDRSTLSHGGASGPPQGTPLAPAIETDLYRPNGAEVSSGHEPNALQNLAHSFGDFSDSHLFDLQGLGHTNGHNGLQINSSTYDLHLGDEATLQRTGRNSGHSSYSAPSDMNSFMAHASLAPGNHQNRWHA